MGSEMCIRDRYVTPFLERDGRLPLEQASVARIRTKPSSPSSLCAWRTWLRIFVFCVPASSWPKERCERRAAAALSVVGRCRRRPRSQRSSGTVGAPARFCCVRGGGPARGRIHAPFVCVSWSCTASRVCPQRCPTTPRRALTWHRACDRRGAHGACDSFQRRCAAVARTRLPSRSALTAPALASAAACAAGIAHARLAAAHPAPCLLYTSPSPRDS